MRALKSHNITNDVIVAEDGVQAVQYLFGATGPPRPEELTAVVLLDPNLPLLVVVVAALVWNSLPLALTAGWVGAVTAAAALRTWWRLGLSRRTASPEEALRGVRLTVAGVGLAWGFGAAAAIPALGLDQAALILVVLAGIVAGATGTLVGDRRSFRYLLLTALAPLPIGILLHGHSRVHLIATLLIVLFVGGMDRVHRRAYRTFVERVRAAVLLPSSTQAP